MPLNVNEYVWIFVRKNSMGCCFKRVRERERNGAHVYTIFRRIYIQILRIAQSHTCLWIGHSKNVLLLIQSTFKVYLHGATRNFTMNLNTTRGNAKLCFTPGLKNARANLRDSILFCRNDRLLRCCASGLSCCYSQVATSSAAQLDAHFLLHLLFLI